ncbi:Fibrous sheath-interacting protein [Quillaja saponaria]|uniref:Fibrous sheath-interacting protein n=1 Tax=Quillaja saponaria TaxID=32244 RepID=A0AAD7M2Q7_QUISA|nr:Fibrous sheath-interacting protein [Quillaja saponaria]
MRPPRPPPPSLHSNFFSSLKQVEKRLKLEHPSQIPSPSQSPLQEVNFSTTQSLSSPIFLQLGQSNESSTLQDSSEPPQAFLSISQNFSPTHQDPPQINALDHPRISEYEEEEIDDIQQLMQLLGLSEEERQRVGFDDDSGCSSCYCEGGFYSKIVGVKGPKCKKEARRLDGWIQHFLDSGEEGRKQPLRLAHLLLGKAAFISEGADGGFGGLEFPSTIEEFLHHDPPKD